LPHVKIARACQFIEAVTAHDFEVAEELLDPDVETVTPRGTLRGIAVCRQVLQKASGDEQFPLEYALRRTSNPAMSSCSRAVRRRLSRLG
jgi:hypothetical protein